MQSLADYRFNAMLLTQAYIAPLLLSGYSVAIAYPRSDGASNERPICFATARRCIL